MKLRSDYLALLHPVLFAVFPVLFLFAQNADEARIYEVTYPLILVAACALGATLLLAAVLTSLKKGALVTAIAVLLFFSFGHIVGALPNFRLTVGESIIGRTVAVLVVWLTLLSVCIWIVARTRSELNRLTNGLSFASVILILIQIFHGSLALVNRHPVKGTPALHVDQRQLPERRPDIYYVVLDAYAGADVLKDIYGFDNSGFLRFLEEEGFQVADYSHSNYGETLVSLAATLNLDYVSAIGDADTASSNRMTMQELLHDNRAFRLLRDLGYAVVAFASGYSHTEFVDADLYISESRMASEFQNILISMTPVPAFQSEEASPYGKHRDRILSVLEKLPRIHEVESPKLVIAHIVCPHPPYVFDSVGNPVQPNFSFHLNDGTHFYRSGGTVREYIDGYRNQVAYLNSRLRMTIKELLRRPKDELPIIIVQGDHGPRSKFRRENWSKNCYREHYSILNAVFLPDDLMRPVREWMSPVNNFRLVFGACSYLDLELLPDRILDSDYTQPFKCRVITSDAVTYGTPERITYDAISGDQTAQTKTGGDLLHTVTDNGLLIDLGTGKHSQNVEIVVNRGDEYRLYFCAGDFVAGADVVTNPSSATIGLRTDTVCIPPETSASGYDTIVLIPETAGGQVDIGRVRLL